MQAIHNKSRWIVNDRPLLGLLKEIITLSQESKTAQYICIHYSCVMAAFEKFRPYFLEFLIFWDTPAVLISIGNGEKKSLAELLNTVVRELNEHVQTNEFTKSIREKARCTERRFTNAKKHISTLRNENLTVVSAALIIGSKDDAFSIDKANMVFAQFKQAMRRKKALDLKGFIWKLERGFDGNFYYHCIFFLKANEQMKATKVAQVIIELWNEKLRSLGYISPLTSRLTHFNGLAAGSVDLSDEGTYKQLFNFIRYHCKKDQFIVHKSLSGKPTFDTGRSRSIRMHLGRPVNS
mgnify:CR=1 FL=1